MSVVRMVTRRATSTSSAPTSPVDAPRRGSSTIPVPDVTVAVAARESGVPIDSSERNTATSRSGSKATTSTGTVRPSGPTTETVSDPATTWATVTMARSATTVPTPNRVRGPHPSTSTDTVAAAALSTSGAAVPGSGGGSPVWSSLIVVTAVAAGASGPSDPQAPTVVARASTAATVDARRAWIM